jgi:hypothetical protein
MAFIGFGLLLICAGLNFLYFRTWWVEQMLKSPLAPPGSLPFLKGLIGLFGLLTIFAGLFFLMIGIFGGMIGMS